MRLPPAIRNLAPLLLCFALCVSAHAHSMYQSAVLLDYHPHSVDAEIQLPPSKLGIAYGQPLSSNSLGVVRDPLTHYILDRFHVRTPTKADWNIAVVEPPAWVVMDGAPYIVVHLRLTPPEGASERSLLLEDDIITDSLPSHAVLVSVRSDWDSSTFANDPELVGILNGEERQIVIDRAGGNWAKGFGSVFRLGVRHIAEGTDHLLFLLALLLPAPLVFQNGRWGGFAGVRHGFVQILKVVTSFTVGHSITLALAASGVVKVPGRPIEALIAVSILVSASHAIRPLFPGREALIAASFGLIHGLAFASTLAELGLHRWERVASIFSFNIGIEAMQLVVVLCVMPSLMLLSRTKAYPSFRVFGALFAGIAACGWIIERVFNLDLHVDKVVDVLAKHSILLVLVLFVIAIVANLIAVEEPPRLESVRNARKG